jgi:hypothetical protein
MAYVSSEEVGPMRDARVGSTVTLPDRGPPWIVVFHDAASVMAARWPGRLLRVRVLEAAAERDQPLSYARYTRCNSVVVESEEEAAVLFGLQGAKVVSVLDTALRLDRSEAEALSRGRHADAPAAYDRVWRAWLTQEAISDEYTVPLDGALSIGRLGSPIGQGLSLIYETTFKRAKVVDGDAAIESDDEDVWLVEPWDGAARVLGDAALALGAPELLDDGDRACLLSGWRAVYE